MKLRTCEFDTGVYHCTVRLAVGPGKEFAAWVKRNYRCNDGLPEGAHVAECLEFCQEGGGSEFVLWFESFSRVAADMYTLVHETHHLANKILRYCGVVENENGEAFAYLQEHLFRECWRRLTK